MNNSPRHFKQLMADRPERGGVVALRQAEPFEPCYQIPGQLSDQKSCPVGDELLCRQLLQTEVALVLLNQILHRRTLEKPLHQWLGSSPQVIGDHAVVFEQGLLLLIPQLDPFDDVATRRPPEWRIPKFGDLSFI